MKICIYLKINNKSNLWFVRKLDDKILLNRACNLLESGCALGSLRLIYCARIRTDLIRAYCELKMATRIKSNTIIVYSESLVERDFLRSRISESGLNVVCFENQAICFDNIKPISPKIVIVLTDILQIAYRFVFALHAMDLSCSLLIVSDLLEANQLSAIGLGFPVQFIARNHQGDQIMARVFEMFGEADVNSEKTSCLPLFLGQNDVIRQIRSLLPSLARSRDCLLVTGERGTGKELLIRLIAKSAGAENLIIKINCGELSPLHLGNDWLKKLLNAEKDYKPISILLDGIHLMSHKDQIEILLTMDELGKWKHRDRSVNLPDVRFLATSDVPTDYLLQKGQFRKDLFYRLNVIPIVMPPLRQRKEDIALLMDYFIIDAAAGSGKCVMIPSQKARDTLYLYHWPGNVEELKTYMRRISIDGNESCILANDKMPKVKINSREYFLKSASMEDLPKLHEIKNYLPDTIELSLKHICAEFVSRTEKKIVQKALEATNWNRKKAAQLLNISYKSMLNKMKTYDII